MYTICDLLYENEALNSKFRRAFRLLLGRNEDQIPKFHFYWTSLDKGVFSPIYHTCSFPWFQSQFTSIKQLHYQVCC